MKDIPGYEGLYAATPEGRVWSHPKKSNAALKGRFIKSVIYKKGYTYVVLYREGTPKRHMVHRLIALTFIPNPDKLPQVNHLNMIRHDNRIENLEWCDSFRNMQHAVASGSRRGPGRRFGS